MFRATVTKNDMILEGEELITSGSVKTNFVIFTFDAVWDGIVKTAVFRTKKVQIPVIIDEVTLKVAIPWEAMAFPKETIELGVYGVRPDDEETESIDEEIVIPTIWKTLGKVVEGTTVIVPPPTAPTKDSYKQLLEYILALKPGSGDGESGFSPTVSVEEAEDGSGFKVTIIDVNGPKEFFIHNGVDGKDGSNGADGTNGEDGADGVSPTFSITELANGYQLTITDANGEQTIAIYDGLNGTNGTDGADGLNGRDGENGATFTPSISESGDLSWTNDKDLPNPPTVNIKGPPGEGGSGGGIDLDIDDTLVMDLDNVLGVKTPIRPLTSAEYQMLTEEEKNKDILYVITDDNDTSSGGASENQPSDIYSENEVRIGTYFGKPLYRLAFRLSGVSITFPEYPNTSVGAVTSGLIELVKGGLIDESIKNIYNANSYTIVRRYFSTINWSTPYITNMYTGNLIMLSVGGNSTMGPALTISSTRYIQGVNVPQPFTNVSGTLIFEYTKTAD